MLWFGFLHRMTADSLAASPDFIEQKRWVPKQFKCMYVVQLFGLLEDLGKMFDITMSVFIDGGHAFAHQVFRGQVKGLN